MYIRTELRTSDVRTVNWKMNQWRIDVRELHFLNRNAVSLSLECFFVCMPNSLITLTFSSAAIVMNS